MLKLLNKRERVILAATFGVIIFSVIFNFLIAPVLAKNDSLNKEINLARRKLEKSLRLVSQKDYLNIKYSRLSPIDEASGETPDTSVSVLSELERLAKGANIRLLEIRPQPSKQLKLYKEALIDLRTEGDMENYLKFIYDIEHSPFLLRLKRLQLSTKPNTLLLQGNLSISQLIVLE